MASDYFYDLPPELIAQKPAEPRDSSRLFVYDTKKGDIHLDIFRNIAKYLPDDSLLVLNDTKVVPARLQLKKRTGGSVRILFLMNEWDGSKIIKGLPDRKITIGDELRLLIPLVRVVHQNDELFTFEILVDPDEFRKIINKSGVTPLPPYIQSDLSEEERRNRYQTIFARNSDNSASVAAPTASLHFTDGVFSSLKEKGIGIAMIALHVGRGTFSPVDENMKTSGRLHSEPFSIVGSAARQIMMAKAQNHRIIAAGTTALRALETAGSRILRGEGLDGETSIFIRKPYKFQVADALITNFHLPNTSLLMLLEAFLDYRGAEKSWWDLYEIAVKEKFRFYSFGDAMLII